MNIKQPKILFFVNGVSPSPEDMKAAKALSEGRNAKVVFRNARAVPSEEHSLEMCDGVAGAVPAIYAKAFQVAEAAIAEADAALDELSKKVGDVKAPKGKKAAAAEDVAKESWTANKPA